MLHDWQQLIHCPCISKTVSAFSCKNVAIKIDAGDAFIERCFLCYGFLLQRGNFPALCI